ncbi:tail assembly chaperone [Staphylococcus aureus]|uniref:tail assembly chaperone n=1 Tax=Staphylococcus aureus TaxID=1280 RepID=UPI0004498C83|nr:tail assembly chaperone [Staphylococcus aureus]EZY71816.1 hypothetical protein V065_02575 [Staphylococcus aureus R0611]
MTETKFNPITALTIDGKEVQAKATFMFDIKAEKFASEADKEGTKEKISGFRNLYNNLLECKTISIVDFWECATAYMTNNAPKRKDIESAVMAVIEEENDTLGLLQGALDVLNNSGFFKQESRAYWMQMNKAPSMAKEEEKENVKNGIEMMKENYKEIMGSLPY